MSEIYKNTSQFIYLDVYGGTADDTPTALFVDQTGTSRALTVTQDTPPQGIEDRYHVVLNMADTQNEGDIRIEWSFEMEGAPVAKTDYLTVVTPYLSISEIKAIVDDIDDAEAIALERAVRHIINSHCGQTFGSYTGTKTIDGANSYALRLNERLARLDKIDGLIVNPNLYSLKNNGYIINYAGAYPPSLKADYHGYHMHSNGVIHNPNHISFNTFNYGMTYDVYGVWGWFTVPESVKEAAKLLVNDYACADSAYRDRYLVSMTAADWRIQFNEQAYLKTGNVRADQLLKPYVVMLGLGVI